MGLGRFGEIGSITLVTVVLSLVIYWFLIRHQGANGAVMGSVIVYGFYAMAVLSRRIHYSRHGKEVQTHV